MKKFFLPLFIVSVFVSCKATLYVGNYGQVNQTQVVLSGANFKVLGSFTGVATQKKFKMTVQDQQGLISVAKAKILANAKAAGVDLTGSRALVNVCVDVVQNSSKVTVTVSGEIIEFTK